MRRATLLLFFAIGCALAAGPAAAQVYRWVDKDGKVHYSDKKPKDAAAKDLNIDSKPTDPNATDAAVELEQLKQRNAVADEEKMQRDETEQQRKRHADQRARTCEDWRARLNVLERVNRVVTVDAQGKEVYLNDAQAEAERATARKKVAENCD